MENNQNFIDKYREFVTKVSQYHEGISTFTDERIMNIGKTFTTEINTNSKLQKYLLAKNNKFFNTNKKTNVKIDIIPNVSIKQLIKKSENVEMVVWNYLQMLYVIFEVNNPNSATKTFVNQIIQQLQSTINIPSTSSDRTNMDDMIFDIAETFKSLSMESNQAQPTQNQQTQQGQSAQESPGDPSAASAASSASAASAASSDHQTTPSSPFGDLGGLFGGNTIDNILKTSQIIAQKYQTKIETGEMSMEDMIQSLGKMLPTNGDNEDNGGNGLIDNIFSRQDVDQDKLEEMKAFYANENISISKDDINNVSEQLNSKIGEISSSVGECMEGSQDLTKLLSGITQLSSNLGSV